MFVEENENRNEKRVHYWPLLLLPIAFLVGWGGNQALEERNRQITGPEYGVGAGAPIIIPCESSNPTQTQ